MKAIRAMMLASVILLTGCAVRDTSLEDIRSAGYIRIAIADEDERLRELADHIARSNGVTAEYYLTDKDSALNMLSTESVDIAVGYYARSEGLLLDYRASIPFYNGTVYVVFNESNMAVCKEDTRGALLGASDRLTSHLRNDISELSTDKTNYCTDVSVAGGMLGNGTLDYFYCTESEAVDLTSEYPNLRCCAVSDIDHEQYSIVVLKDDTQLYNAVNKAIGELLTGGN